MKNSKNKSNKKERKPKITFRERLVKKLFESNLGDDNSSWITLRTGDYCVSISLLPNDETIDRISVHKDIIGVVDTKQLFSTK